MQTDSASCFLPQMEVLREEDPIPRLTDAELLDRVAEPWSYVSPSLRAGANIQRNHRQRRSEG